MTNLVEVNSLEVDGGKKVVPSAVLQNTISGMSVAWTDMLSKLAEGSTLVSARLNEVGTDILNDLSNDFNNIQKNINNNILPNIKNPNTSDPDRAAFQGELQEALARANELMNVDNAQQGQVGNQADRQTDEAKQNVQSGSDLVGNTVVQISQMVYGTAASEQGKIS